MAAINFNAAEVAPQTAFDPLPPGNYVAVITESEEKATKAGTGSYLQLTFEVVEGQYQGRKVWARLNLNNPNDQAVAIARAELSAICHAVNVIDLKDTTQLHDLPMAIRLNAKPDQSGEVRNEIKKYEAIANSNRPAATAQQQQKPAATANTKPWGKK
jgi:hypothetical protein